MPKPVIKDIQIKKKTTLGVKNPEVSNRVLSKPKIKEEIIPEFIPVEIEEDFIIQKKINKPRNNRFRNWVILILVTIGIISVLIYLITGVKLTIIPEILNKNVNESITLSSWTTPIKSSVMSVSESTEITIDEEETRKILAEKIKNRFKYDTPKDYIILNNCTTNFYYESKKTEDGAISEMKVSASALILEKSGLMKYITKSMKIENETIKDIDKLECILKTDITNYQIGQRSGSLSFLINGEIKTEKNISVDDIKNQIAGRLKNKAIFDLDQNESILNYTIKLRPFNFFPVIPKNLKHIDVILNSAI